MTITLEQREADYAEAERLAFAEAERWIEARAGGRLTSTREAAMSHAERELLRAKRRLERAQRKASPKKPA